MVETAEKTRPIQKGISFRQKLCRGLELSPRNPQRKFIALLQEYEDVTTVALTLEQPLTRKRPFDVNGTHPLPQIEADAVDAQVITFSLWLLRRSKNNPLVPQVIPQEVIEDATHALALRVRRHLGCSNTMAARYKFSREFYQRLGQPK